MRSILCAVNHGLYPPWLDILKNGQENTWLLSPTPENIEIVHVHGTPVNTLVYKLDRFHEHIRWSVKHGHRVLKWVDNLTLVPWMNYIPNISESEILKTRHKSLHVHFPDSYVTHRWKALSLMRYFLDNTEHEYLLSTTTASYINLRALSATVNGFESGDLYFGALPYEGAGFVSGSNRILSRETVKKVISSKKYWTPGIIEDLALGQLLKKVGILPTYIPILNISSLQELDDLDYETFQRNYHFRLKSGTNDNRNDVSIMRALHLKYGSIE